MKNKKIAIIGSGLAGSFLAVLLAQRGFTVTLYERLSEKEVFDANEERSYNITFYAYGIDLLKNAGVWDVVKPHLLPLHGAWTQLSKYSKPIFSPIYNEKAQYYAISRSTLISLLIKEALRHPNVTIHYQTPLLSVNRHDKTIIVRDEGNNKLATVKTDIVIGADGANSLVRGFMQQGQNTTHSQQYSSGGYRQFVITKEQVAQLRLPSSTGFTWSAKGKFILAFPNFNGSLAALLIFPVDKTKFNEYETVKKMQTLLADDFPRLSPIAEAIAQQVVKNPNGVFTTIKTDPWFYKDFVTVIGDAAHGFYPFFGQGASSAFGDCMQLVSLIDTYGTQWEKVFSAYQMTRKRHMDALGELSRKALGRYMRNKRADASAIYEKLESLGSTLLPKYIHPPLYQPVMNNPAKTADYVANHLRQRKILKRYGLPLAVFILTKGIALYEKIQESNSRIKRKFTEVS